MIGVEGGIGMGVGVVTYLFRNISASKVGPVSGAEPCQTYLKVPSTTSFRDEGVD